MNGDTEQYRKVWWRNTELWAYSLFSTFISGGASSLAAMVIDPTKFNIHEGAGNVGKMFLTAGLISVLPLLKQSPLPKLPPQTDESQKPQ